MESGAGVTGREGQGGQNEREVSSGGGITTATPRNEGTNETIQCDMCLKPFQLLSNLDSGIGQTDKSLRMVLDDAALKIRLFLGHVLRFQVQRLEFEDAQHNVNSMVRLQSTWSSSIWTIR